MNDLDFERLLELTCSAPGHRLSSTYDGEADVMYVNFKWPSVADDSELTDDDVVVRYEGEEVIGLTILHASTRLEAQR